MTMPDDDLTAECLAWIREDALTHLSETGTYGEDERKAIRLAAFVRKREVEAKEEELNGGDSFRRPAIKQQTPEQVLVEMLNPAKMDKEEQQAVFTLLTYLKKPQYMP